MAGYSNKSLKAKLGLKEEETALFINPIKNYFDLLGIAERPNILVEYSLNKIKNLKDTYFDFIQYFSTSKEELGRDFPILKSILKKNGMLWISRPKATSRIQTDLSESLVMKIGLDNGLVDVKVCAIDEDWSGLKFVWRLKDR